MINMPHTNHHRMNRTLHKDHNSAEICEIMKVYIKIFDLCIGKARVARCDSYQTRTTETKSGVLLHGISRFLPH